jgi:hypothetical protein
MVGEVTPRAPISVMNAKNADGILAIWNDCPPGRRAEFEAWYQGEHLPERLSVPGFLFGRRLEALSGSPRYFTFYVTESPDVLTSAPYVERLNNPTPLTQAVMLGGFKNTNRTVCRRAARAGRFRGSVVATLRFREAPDSAALVSLVVSLTHDPGVASAEFWEAVDLEPASAATEERLRGGDKSIRACFTVDTLRESKAKAIASDLSERFPAAEIGVYRLLCQIGRGDI